MRVTPVAYKLEQSVIGQKMCFIIVCINVAARVKNVIFSTIFRKSTRNSLFLRCKISIGNNSSSIKDRVVQFAYSRGFSATADRIV